MKNFIYVGRSRGAQQIVSLLNAGSTYVTESDNYHSWTSGSSFLNNSLDNSSMTDYDEEILIWGLF